VPAAAAAAAAAAAEVRRSDNSQLVQLVIKLHHRYLQQQLCTQRKGNTPTQLVNE
jgi:hypothetical protein